MPAAKDTAEDREHIAVLPDTLGHSLKNQKDAKGRKQGLWDHLVHGKVTGYENYENGILHGHFKYRTGYMDTVEGEYDKGMRNGILSTYVNDSLAIQVLFFRSDTVIWSGYPAADYLVDRPRPVKGFHISTTDSIYVRCPFRYGAAIFYEGSFVNGEPAGIHRMYYLNGRVKFIGNYTLRDFVKFNRNGDLISKGKF